MHIEAARCAFCLALRRPDGEVALVMKCVGNSFVEGDVKGASTEIDIKKYVGDKMGRLVKRDVEEVLTVRSHWS